MNDEVKPVCGALNRDGYRCILDVGHLDGENGRPHSDVLDDVRSGSRGVFWWDSTPPEGIRVISAERERQVRMEGFLAYRDDAYTNGELISAAHTYLWVALCETGDYPARAKDFNILPNDWPRSWTREMFKPSDDPIRNLAKAGALIAAEIDRLLRARAIEITKGKNHERAENEHLSE